MARDSSDTQQWRWIDSFCLFHNEWLMWDRLMQKNLLYFPNPLFAHSALRADSISITKNANSYTMYKREAFNFFAGPRPVALTRPQGIIR